MSVNDASPAPEVFNSRARMEVYEPTKAAKKTGDDDMTTMMTQKMARQKNDLAVSA